MNSTGRNIQLRLLLVDDHTVVREGLKRLLDPLSNQWSVAEAGTGFHALECLRREPFDLVIADLSLPGMSGLEMIRRIKESFPAVAVLVLTMHSEEQYALRAFQVGASGYVTKESAGDELIAAVRKVASGGIFVTAALAEQVVQQLSGIRQASALTALSNRELEIMQRIVAGERPVDIAVALHLSIKTVSTHKTRILEKLQLDSTAALIRFGLEHRLDGFDPGTTPGSPEKIRLAPG
ncbi:response regulator [Hydrogenophaga sp. BPS33]|uniref:response regulator n=1 Tax=Hydrogenophaga sp. BPS33 TaxID=2651974 RepID=UPI00131FEDEF|nr:response regulator transcription factor [Hydrogenophaga sp. BPS33]QHE86231.1 response regulator transcription factor [Hydrogenophaga sp. BPS33]